MLAPDPPLLVPPEAGSQGPAGGKKPPLDDAKAKVDILACAWLSPMAERDGERGREDGEIHRHHPDVVRGHGCGATRPSQDATVIVTN